MLPMCVWGGGFHICECVCVYIDVYEYVCVHVCTWPQRFEARGQGCQLGILFLISHPPWFLETWIPDWLMCSRAVLFPALGLQASGLFLCTIGKIPWALGLCACTTIEFPSQLWNTSKGKPCWLKPLMSRRAHHRSYQRLYQVVAL